MYQPIYVNLADHQVSEEWNGREMMHELHHWANRFIVEFKLDIPEVALCLDRLPKNRFGHFRCGHNGFGLLGEIAINTRYLMEARPYWQVLGTLLHELLHGWQQTHGRPSRRNHHNLEFRQKAWELGLIVDRFGVASYQASSPFRSLLAAHGIDTVEPKPTGSHSDQPSRSKLKKWQCCCQPPVNVRVAVAHFRARCLTCGCEFKRVD